MTASLNGSDYLLLLLFLREKTPIKGAVRLEKMMFLFTKEISKELKKTGLESLKLPSFIAYNFGPFAKDVYEQVEFFRGIDFIRITNLNAPDEMSEVDDWEENPFIDELWANEDLRFVSDSKYMKYEIADKGEKFVKEKLIPLISNEQKVILEKFKTRIVTLKIKEILHYVYVNYPEFTKNSLIKGEVLGSE